MRLLGECLLTFKDKVNLGGRKDDMNLLLHEPTSQSTDIMQDHCFENVDRLGFIPQSDHLAY